MWLFEDSLENFILLKAGLELQVIGDMLPKIQKVLQGAPAERTQFLADLTKLEKEIMPDASRQLHLLIKAIRQLVETQGQDKTGGRELVGYYAMAWQQLLTGKPPK